VQCLLLEDLEEVARFDGFARLDSTRRAFSSPAELRLYQSNLAVLPIEATGFQWRLADIDLVTFDEASYTVTLRSEDESLFVTKLAKRTREFRERLRVAMTQLTERGAQTIRGMFPFLTPDQFQQVAELMKEGRAAPLTRLQVIHAKTEQALIANVVDSGLRPYFDALRKRVPPGMLYTGFKLIRAEATEAEGEQTEEAGVEATQAGAEGAGGTATVGAAAMTSGAKGEQREAVLHWFFFPLANPQNPNQPSDLVAWEATSQSGRATYIFRLRPPGGTGSAATSSASLDAALRELNRALLLLNFRRAPIYLSDDSLAIRPRYRHYAIACRKIPELRRLRAAFLGRALHTSLATWEKQIEAFLDLA
jgi:hypothetical protein